MSSVAGPVVVASGTPAPEPGTQEAVEGKEGTTDFFAVVQEAASDEGSEAAPLTPEEKKEEPVSPLPATPAPSEPTSPPVVGEGQKKEPLESVGVVPPPAAKPPEVPSVPPVSTEPAGPVTTKPLTEDELKAKRNELVEAFASHYKLSDEDEAALHVEPNKVLPKLAGNIAADVFEATSRIIFGQLPTLIHQYMQSSQTAAESRKAFFEAYPALNKPEYLPVIQQVAGMYKQMNPKAPYAEAMKAIGRHTMVMLGLPLEEGQSSASAPPPPPLKPAAPLAPGAAAARPAASPGNIFSELASFELVDE